MVNWLFKQPGAARAAAPTPPAPRSVPVKTGPTPQQKAEARARQLEQARIEWVDRLEDSLIGKNSAVVKDQTNHQAYRLMIGDDSEVLL